MQPPLKRILDTTLSQLGISDEEWDALKEYRVAKTVRVKQIVAFLAHKSGYTHLAIAEFLRLSRPNVTHHIAVYKDLCSVYADVREELEGIEDALNSGTETMLRYSGEAWLARSMNGLLTISSSEPEKVNGYWLAMGTRPFHPQSSFPQVTYESGPMKVKFKVTIDQ